MRDLDWIIADNNPKPKPPYFITSSGLGDFYVVDRATLSRHSCNCSESRAKGACRKLNEEAEDA